MFHDIRNYPFLEAFVSQLDRILEEYESQIRAGHLDTFLTAAPGTSLSSHIDYWAKDTGIVPEDIGYSNDDVTLVAFPLYKKNFPVKTHDIPNSFPILYDLLMQIPGINFSAFFRLAPGKEILEHQHNQANLIFHLCLSDLDGECIMRCNGEERTLKKKGDHVLFDYSKPHSAVNHSGSQRINLIIDFSPAKSLSN